MSFIKTPCIEGEGLAVSEQRNVAPFSAIDLNIDADMTVTAGATQSLEVGAQENILAVISTEVAGNVLDVTSTECFSTSEGVSLEATIPSLQQVTTGASGSVNGSGFSVPGLELVTEGSGAITITDTTVSGTATVRTAASGNIELTGSAGQLVINVDGSGNVTADECPVAECSVTIGGSGSARVDPTDTLNVTIMGSGNVYYRGNPAIQKNIMGTGQLIPIE